MQVDDHGVAMQVHLGSAAMASGQQMSEDEVQAYVVLGVVVVATACIGCHFVRRSCVEMAERLVELDTSKELYRIHEEEA